MGTHWFMVHPYCHTAIFSAPTSPIRSEIEVVFLIGPHPHKNRRGGPLEYTPSDSLVAGETPWAARVLFTRTSEFFRTFSDSLAIQRNNANSLASSAI